MNWPKRFRFLYKPRNIYQCAAFFTYLHFFAACSGFWYKRGRFITNRWTKIYTVIMPFIILVALLLCLTQLYNDPLDSEFITEMDQLALSTFILELFMSVFSLFVTSFSMLINLRQHLELYDRIYELDQKLIRDFGVRMNYHKLFLKNTLEMFGLFIIYLTSTFWSVLIMAPNRIAYASALGMIYFSCISGTNLTSILHTNFALILRIRFRLIQKLLDVDYLEKLFKEKKLREVRLINLVDIVRSLHEIIASINSVYSRSLLAGLLHDFTLITTELYLLFGHSMGELVDYQFYIYSWLWICVPLYRIITEPIYCHMAVAEGKRCLHLIKHIDNYFPNFKSSKLIVDSAMHWRLANVFEFTCGSTMIYSKPLILTIAAVIFKYLLILIQFRMTQLMGEQIEAEKHYLVGWIGDL